MVTKVVEEENPNLPQYAKKFKNFQDLLVEKYPDKLIKCVKDRIENTLNNRFVNIKDALVGKTLVELLNNSDIVKTLRKVS